MGKDYSTCHAASQHNLKTPLRTFRRQKSKTKRKIIIAVWSLAFAYFSLTSTEVDSAAATKVEAQNDVYPDNDALMRSVSTNRGNVVIF